MITSAILFVFLSVYVGALSLFPDADTIPYLQDAVDFLTEHLGSASALFPVDYMLAAVAIVLAFELRLVVVKSVMLVVGFIRGGH